MSDTPSTLYSFLGALVFLGADLRLVHLDAPSQPFPLGTHHGSPKFVEPRPRGQVAPQAENLLDCDRAGSGLLAGDLPDGSKPQS